MSTATPLMVVCPACEAAVADESKGDGELRDCPQCGYRFEWRCRASCSSQRSQDPWRDLLSRLPIPRAVVEHTARRVTHDSLSVPPTLAPPRPLTRRNAPPELPALPSLVATGQLPHGLMTNGHSVAEYASPVPAEPNLSGASDSLTIEAAPRILSESQVADRDSDSLEAVRAEHESDLAATHPPAGLARISPLWWVTGITLVACLAVIVAVIQRGLGNGSMTRQPDPSSSVAAAGGDARDSAADIGLDLYADWPRDRLPQVADIWSRVGPYIVSVERTTADGPQIAA